MISERTLEEDEAKIDNLLHKILESNRKIALLADQISSRTADDFILERTRMLHILTETVGTLAQLADEIDMHDARMLERTVPGVRAHLQDAIGTIRDAERLLGPREQ